MLAKFFTGGVKFGFGGGLVTKVNSTLANVTRSLRALQTQVKAKAILEIAAAVAILAASVIALSLVNSAALTKALAAISVGFGELIGALTLLDKFIGVTGGFKLTLIATTLIGLAIAIDILAIAIAALGHLNPTQLAQGLGGVAAALALLVGAVKLLDSDPEGLIAAATAMGVMSLSLLIIADVVKKFGNLSFGVLAKGLGSIALALGIQSLDSKIVVAGYSSNGSNYDFALVRYNTNGSLDTTFGTGGIVITPMGSGYDIAYALGIGSDGRILAAGYYADGFG